MRNNFGFSALLVFLGANLASFAAASVAEANRFTCTSVDQYTQIEVKFKDRRADHGPRAEQMVVKDLSLKPENQLIARFLEADGVLRNTDGLVVARVDLSNPNSNRRGERVGGTVLGALGSIELEIDISYREPVADGVRFAAQAKFKKKSGQELIEDFDCVHLVDFSRADTFLF